MCLFNTFTVLITDVETGRFTITFKLGFNEAGTDNFVWVISDFSACNDHSLSFTLRVQFSTHLKTLILDIFPMFQGIMVEGTLFQLLIYVLAYYNYILILNSLSLLVVNPFHK